MLLVERIESELVWLSETCLSETDDSDEDKDKETDSLVLKEVECDSLALIELDSLALNEADSLALMDEEWLSNSLKLSDSLKDEASD
ncbi:hypothetical protein [Streptococcus suis]|uniref:hypothetical protein n=1 Tax=Streptococcus suis TaxID=1307 RepID=UPI0027422466